MGNSLYRRLFGNNEVRILFMGLDAAGKTTSLYTMKLGEVVTTIPTIGFNVETIQLKKFTVTAWDVGGRDKIRPLYRHYYANTQGLVFVLDSNDRDRLDEALKELFRTAMEDDLTGVPILVLANKQDIVGALKPVDIASKLHEEKCMRDKRWNVFGVIATNPKDNGLFEAFSWLADAIAACEKNNFASKLLNHEHAKGRLNGADKNPVDNQVKSSKYFHTRLIESIKSMIR